MVAQMIKVCAFSTSLNELTSSVLLHISSSMCYSKRGGSRTRSRGQLTSLNPRVKSFSHSDESRSKIRSRTPTAIHVCATRVPCPLSVLGARRCHRASSNHYLFSPEMNFDVWTTEAVASCIKITSTIDGTELSRAILSV
jgi:hypothetical protein